MLPVYSVVVSGELAGATSATPFPDVPCRLVVLKALSDNAGSVYVGGAGVTVPNGSTDTTSGLQLNAGEQVTLYIDNLNKLYRICANAGDDLTYVVMR